MMVLRGVEWDRKEFSESNLHVCGRNDTKIRVYNMERWLKERGQKKRSLERKTLENNLLNTGNCVH